MKKDESKSKKSKNTFERMWKWLQGSARKPTTLEVLISIYNAKVAEARYKRDLKNIDKCWESYMKEQEKMLAKLSESDL